MYKDVITAYPSDSVEQAAREMNERRTKCLPAISDEGSWPDRHRRLRYTASVRFWEAVSTVRPIFSPCGTVPIGSGLVITQYRKEKTAMTKFVKVAKKSELPDTEGTLEEVADKGTLVEVEGHRIALFNMDGEVFAIDDACTHDGGSLSEGTVQGDEVECPNCGSRFSVVSGGARGFPAIEDVASYEVRDTDDDVEVEV